MWRMIFFIPLLALTIYIFIKTREDENDIEEDEEFLEEKEHLIDLAIRMMHQGKDYADEDAIEADFSEYDFSDPEKPFAKFSLFTDRKTIPFEAKNGSLIRYKDKQ